MPRKKKTNNIETQTDELDDDVIEKTDEIKFHCPVCQHILEVQNEMVIKKKVIVLVSVFPSHSR